ncbi:MAG: enoyl-CoA hydratase/isomerase family protein [Betaproteobacteria bacterium]
MEAQSVDLLIEIKETVGIITLNRPKALNSLNLEMIRGMHQILQEWEKNPQISAVVIQGAGEKAFCAGGDIRQLYDSVKSGGDDHMTFFEEEFVLNEYIFRYPKPYIALMDRYVMGGGMGISQGASIRIVSELSKLAMPETGIGYFPDVGGSYFLSRCPGSLGLYLGITGLIFDGADAIYAGLADWYLPHDHFQILMQELVTLSKNPKEMTKEKISRILERKLGGETNLFTKGRSKLAKLKFAIENHFSKPTVPQIVESLKNEKNPEFTEWANQTLEIMEKRSTFAMVGTQLLLRYGRELNLSQCFAMEYGLIPGWMKEGDFIEGVRSVIIDKDFKPQWKYSLNDLNVEQIEGLFAHVK